MNEKIIKLTSSIGLFIGGIFGLAGSFAPTDLLRCIAWNIDGVGLTIATFLLAYHYKKIGMIIPATGFLTFAIGECAILSSNGIDLDEHIFAFGIGTGFWTVSLLVISSQKIYSIFTRITGFIAAVLFLVVSILIFTDHSLNPLTKPLPFYAYPFFAMTIFGWAWSLILNHLPSPEYREPASVIREF
jgi:hypothetical protein